MCVEKHHSQHFVVTCKHQMNYRGILTGFELRGYLLETYSEEGGFRQHIIHMYCDANYDDELQYLKSIYIQDFIADSGMRNKGYGSIIMQQLVQYAKVLNVQYISGMLSFVDVGNTGDESKRENRERLYHFYNKHGFQINESGKIILYI